MKKTEEKIISKKQGITLIALVITIIVLLILAGVSIATLTGENGILTKAGTAKEDAKYSQAMEEVKLAVQAVRIEYQGNRKKITITEETASAIQEELKKLSKDGTVYVDGNIMYSQNRGYIFEIDEGMKVIQSNFEIVEGDIALWQQVDGVLTAYKGDISELDGTTLVIPNYIDGVRIKEIDEGIFGGKILSPLQVEIKISEGIKVIGMSAFAGCTGLVGEIEIPESVTAIKSGAFANCTGITGDLTIKNAEMASGGTFQGCTGLNGKLTLGMEELGSYFAPAHFSGTNFNQLELLDGVKFIGEGAFYNYANLTGDLVIPDSVTTIGSHAFLGCRGFTGELKIGNNVNAIGSGAFESCTGFTGNLIIPNNVTTIGETAFAGCTGFTGELKIGTNVTTIGQSAFVSCTGLTGNLNIPNGVITIGSAAFAGCYGITLVRIPETVTTIGRQAFYIGGSGVRKIIYVDGYSYRPDGWDYEWTNYYYIPGATNVDYELPYKWITRPGSAYYSAQYFNQYEIYYYDTTYDTGRWYNTERNTILGVVWGEAKNRVWYQPQYVNNTWR